MLSQDFNRSTAFQRNSFGYLPTRLFATCSSSPCKVCLIRVSQVKGSVQPSVLVCAPSNRATTCREKCASNGNALWLHSVMEKAASSQHSLRLRQRVMPEKAAFFYRRSMNLCSI